jgi:putative DNA methylase
MRDEAEKRIGHLYPKVKITKEMAKDQPDLKECVGHELPVIAWLWARTVASPNPACGGVHVPLVRSFWLSTKSSRKAWVEPIVEQDRLTYRFEVRTGTGEPRKGTVGRSGGVCLLTGSPIPLEYIRSEGRSGRLDTRLLAVVAIGRGRRVYLAPTPEHQDAAKCTQPPDAPEADLPSEALGFRVQNYGITKYRHLFTNRQLTAMTTLCALAVEAHTRSLIDSDDRKYADALTSYLAFSADKAAEYNCSLVPWYTKEDRPKGLFARQAIPMV